MWPARNKGALRNRNVRPNNVLLSRVYNLSVRPNNVLCNRKEQRHNNMHHNRRERRNNVLCNRKGLHNNMHRNNMHHNRREHRNSRIMCHGQSITGKIFIKQKPRLCIAGVFVFTYIV
jgi:hypothetical protein